MPTPLDIPPRTTAHVRALPQWRERTYVDGEWAIPLFIEDVAAFVCIDCDYSTADYASMADHQAARRRWWLPRAMSVGVSLRKCRHEAEMRPLMTIADDGNSILCCVCNSVSHHPNDIANVYCGYCHKFGRLLQQGEPENR